jgi:AraC-like DNA-binding protein|nr:AraC family transcriptional regulator [uncultured Lachnoclostridium sp.]
MLVKTMQEFQSEVLRQLQFQPFPQKNYILYTNPKHPEHGFFIKYSHKDYYEFGIADYTIPKDFKISFYNTNKMMRFGTVYAGETKFYLDDNPVSSFTPSSFFVVEQSLRGQQEWKRGQHYHGAEITIHEKYFKEVIQPNYPDCIHIEDILVNHTYRYLPLDIVTIIQQLQSLSQKNMLTPIYLESKLLECIAVLGNEVSKETENAFTNQLQFREICIGNHRRIRLTSYDIRAIQKAHDILTEAATNPPTIAALSKMVILNEQKLKAGFLLLYHMTIGEYATSLRMTMAANLLSTTDLSVEEIAKQVGYHYCGNFAKSFKKVYGKTPLQFRKGSLS